MNLEELSWNDDLKKIFLGERYDRQAIKNILMVKASVRRKGQGVDYATESANREEFENYQVVQDVFKKLFGLSGHLDTDVMNSFWTTYKCLLQLNYPNVFTPEGSTRADNFEPLRKHQGPLRAEIGYPPFDSPDYLEIDPKYLTYFRENYPQFILTERMIWPEFLMQNFNQFERVHGNIELMRFARLTHTIGNIVVVPKGFNSCRGGGDYWDLGLNELKLFLTTCGAWDAFLEKHYLRDYVDDDDQVKTFWQQHLTERKLPQTAAEIEQFLVNINYAIEHRGRDILAALRRQ